MPKSKTPRYATFIYKVLKQVHPDVGINGEALAEMNRLILAFLFEIIRVADAINRSFNNPKVTFGTRTVQGAIKLALPGELSRHAISEGCKAVTKYNSSTAAAKEDKESRPKRSFKDSRTGGKKTKAYRSGLMFSPARVKDDTRERMSSFDRLQAGTPVYLAAVLEYLTAEILELAGNSARDNHLVRIRARDIYLATQADEELTKLLKGMIVPGGVVPYIHQCLLPKPKPKTA